MTVFAGKADSRTKPLVGREDGDGTHRSIEETRYGLGSVSERSEYAALKE